MAIKLNLNFNIEWLNAPILDDANVKLGLLRLDQIHPIVSGNKWFKLRYYLTKVIEQNKEGIITFGGAYSNHLVATAAACAYYNIPAIGLVRGLEGEEKPSDTLLHCKKLGMQLAFLSRADYSLKEEPAFIQELSSRYPNHEIIPEGGYGQLGISGAATIHEFLPIDIDFIVTPVGSSTTMIGLIEGSKPQQSIVGFTTMKQGNYLEELINSHTGKKNWELITDYHFGGFGKQNSKLLNFIKEFKVNHDIELDFVYTAKMMYGVLDKIARGELKNCSICCIHTGGLQGNQSIQHLLA